MSATPIGRNDPCPCGSGKKYKKCCIDKAGPITQMPVPASGDGILESDPDQLSNAALDAIEGKRFDEAEKLCERLLKEFPDLIDGHERLAMLREAEGRFQDAADQYSRVLEMMERRPAAFDSEAIGYIKDCRGRVLSKVKA